MHRQLGLRTHPICIEVDKCVQQRIESLDALDMFLSEFKRGDPAIAKERQLIDCGRKRDTHLAIITPPTVPCGQSCWRRLSYNKSGENALKVRMVRMPATRAS